MAAKLDLSRQAKLLDNLALAKMRVLIIGCGGIGSNAAYTLASIGVGKITLYDPDRVGSENLATQFFFDHQAEVTDTAEHKAFALEDNIRNAFGLAAPQTDPVIESYLDQKEEADVVLVATDSLASRRAIWKHHRISGWRWWIDARMGATTFVMFCTPGDDPEVQGQYKDVGLDKWPDTTPPCGQKATAFITKGFAPGYIGLAVAQISRGERPEFYTRLTL